MLAGGQILWKIWMGIAFLRGLTSRVSTTTSSCCARAFSVSSDFGRKGWLTTSRGGGRGDDGVLLFAAANTNNGNEDSADDEQVPATGWNHNQPKNPGSTFWETANGDSAAKQQRRQDQNSTSNAETPRTGWLHNTVSESKKKAAATASEKSVGGNKAQQRLQQAMLDQERNHRIVNPATFHACGNDRQIVVTEHRLSVPVYRPDKQQPRIDLAFTIVEEVKDEKTRKWFHSLQQMPPQQRARAYIDKASLKNADDMIVYLQGGPGFGSPTPVTGLSFSQGGSWGAKALDKYKRVVLMDQRGTGKSTPITKQSLEERFPDLFLLDDKGENDTNQLASLHPEDYQKFSNALKQAANYMGSFRADNIVRDAEYLREAMMLPLEPGSPEPGPRPWGGALGQSFGGFCMMSYLSLIDHPPKICLLTGGIAPMLTPAYDAYSSLWERVRERSHKYYEMYPGDIPLVKKIVSKLLEEPATLPSGGKLTARRFLQLGMSLGGSPTSFASMHSLFNSAFLLPDEKKFTRSFLKAIDSAQPFDDNPIYFWLHESIYADGPSNSPTNWAAHRAYEDKVTSQSEFDYRKTSQLETDDTIPTLFFGEMVFPWMAEDYHECSGVGCTSLARALSQKDDWTPLYDGDHMRQVLGDGRSRAAAAVYYDDLYVDFNCSMKVASRGGPLEKCKVYITNDYQHSGLRDDGATIFSKLHGMATGSIRTPS